MINFFKQLFYDNYVFCPWGKYIPYFICKKLKLLRVGVWLLNLKSPHRIEDTYRYYKLTFINGSYGNFWLDKKLYTVRKING